MRAIGGKAEPAKATDYMPYLDQPPAKPQPTADQQALLDIAALTFGPGKR